MRLYFCKHSILSIRSMLYFVNLFRVLFFGIHGPEATRAFLIVFSRFLVITWPGSRGQTAHLSMKIQLLALLFYHKRKQLVHVYEIQQYLTEAHIQRIDVIGNIKELPNVLENRKEQMLPTSPAFRSGKPSSG